MTTTHETSGTNGAAVSQAVAAQAVATEAVAAEAVAAEAGATDSAPNATPRTVKALAEGMSTFVMGRWEAARSRAEREAVAVRQRVDSVEKQVRERLILVQELSKKADETREQVRKRVEDVQGRMISALNVASQSQVKAIRHELDKLSQKLEEMAAARKPAQSDAPQS